MREHLLLHIYDIAYNACGTILSGLNGRNFLALVQNNLNNKIVFAPPYRETWDILIDFLQDMPRKTQERIKIFGGKPNSLSLVVVFSLVVVLS